MDTVWVLRHPTNKLTKVWKADGTIESYDDPKQFIGKEHQVSDIHHLSKILTTLESNSNACIIRGKYKGYEYSRQAEPTDTKKDRVLRRKSVHDDTPHHWLLIDIDNYQPFDYDPILEPVESINEFITLCLPPCFHGASYHWQLSSSAGHPSKGFDRLKAHVWFWLKTPYLSVQLREWAKATNFKGDKSLFDTIQVHYTSAPIFEDGVSSCISVRSGFVDGEFSDEVNLVIDDEIIQNAGDGTAPASRSQRITEVLSGDPIVTLLYDKSMVKSKRSDGGINIVCPRHEHHTGDSGESSSMYFPAHTGGYKHGSFVCLHEHCRGVPQSLFLEALGYDDADDVFDALPDEPRRERGVPEAKHLCTDQANANRIIDNFKTKIIVVSDRWYAWDTRRWMPDDGEAMIKGMHLSRIILKECDKFIEMRRSRKYSQEEKAKFDKIIEALEVWAKKSEMQGTINAALNMAKKVLSVPAELVDAHPWLLNVRNGTVDLRTGKLKPHDPDDLITKMVNVDYDPDATCPTFEEVITRVYREEGHTYKPICDFMKRWFGYCATGSCREQVFVVHWGNGRNGKSTILDTIANVLGDYSGVAAPGLMVSSGKDRHPTEIADLFGRRMVTAHESGENNMLREDFIKQATGGDKLKGRFMTKDFFEFSPTHKLQLLTNHKPIIKGQDEGIWRRVLLVPYTAKFGTEEEVQAGRASFIRDTKMAEHLENELQGILTWIVEGAVEWFREGLVPPDAVLAASKSYQNEQDRVFQFATEVCTIGDEESCILQLGQHDGIYPTYIHWCKASGMHAMNKNNFISALERVVPKYKKSTKKTPRSGETGGRRVDVVVIHGISCPQYYEM